MSRNKIIIATVILFFVLQLFPLCVRVSDKEKKLKYNQEELGHYLFFDRRLSINNTRSCATCHNPEFAFTDGYKRSLGAFADLHQRNSQSLINLSYLKYLTSSDSTIHTLEQQMSNPLFNEHPVEMGVRSNEEDILKKIKNDQRYIKLFKQSFPDQAEAISINTIIRAISMYVSTIVSHNSAYDKYLSGDSTALTISAKNGKQLFFSNELKCATCHGGFNFSAPSVTNLRGDTIYFFNTGLYNIDGKGGFPLYDLGLYQHTKQNNDMGAFRVLSLRNLAFTDPYYHDGSASTLEEVVESYKAGGRHISNGLFKGDGRKNIYKHSLITGFALNSQQKKDLINFLLSLSDSSVIKNPAYNNPFTEDETQ